MWFGEISRIQMVKFFEWDIDGCFCPNEKKEKWTSSCNGWQQQTKQLKKIKKRYKLTAKTVKCQSQSSGFCRTTVHCSSTLKICSSTTKLVLYMNTAALCTLWLIIWHSYYCLTFMLLLVSVFYLSVFSTHSSKFGDFKSECSQTK